MLTVAIAGASGYVGGELLRILLGHPEVEVTSITSERNAGRFAHQIHPQLRGRTELKFAPRERLEEADLLITALPHGRAAEGIEDLLALAPRTIDCSADFRLDDATDFAATYGKDHPAPERLGDFVYGLPEYRRERLEGAARVSGVGCNATVTNLALLPLVRAGLVPADAVVMADVRAGSSEGGRAATTSGQHAERRGVIRAYAPVGHRHEAEVRQMTGLDDIRMSVTAVDTVRGAAAAVHVPVPDDFTEATAWSLWRDAVATEPFLRIVHERRGDHRHPDPVTLSGTNFADLGWALDVERGRLVLLAAIDNLVKGAAGSAVQCLNLMCGFPETTGLDFPALWPH